MMSKKNLLLTSLFLTVAAVASMESVSAAAVLDEVAAAPPPPPPPGHGAPPAPGLPSAAAHSGTVDKNALGQMVRWAQKEKLITIADGVSMDDLLNGMISKKSTGPKPEEAKKHSVKKQGAPTKTQEQMMKELNEKLARRQSGGVTPKTAPADKDASSDALTAEEEKRAAARFDEIYAKQKKPALKKALAPEAKDPAEPVNPWAGALRKSTPAR
jgi:hypothetical protein